MAATATASMAAETAAMASRHGQHIYMYRNVKTNQVIYSLRRNMNNTSALKQLTFVGKKSVPAALRKDMWKPFAIASFPSSNAGLWAFRKLREFRKMHELCWDWEEGKDLPRKKERIKMLMNQKENSVADLAAVLKLQKKRAEELEQRLKEEEQERQAWVKNRWAEIEEYAAKATEENFKHVQNIIAALEKKLAKEGISEKDKEVWTEQLKAQRRFFWKAHTAKKVLDRWNKGQEEKRIKALADGKEWFPDAPTLSTIIPHSKPLPKYGRVRKLILSAQQQAEWESMSVEGVLIRWADLIDAENAAEWPEGVEHGWMGHFRHASPMGEEEPSDYPGLWQDWYEAWQAERAERDELREQREQLRLAAAKAKRAARKAQKQGRGKEEGVQLDQEANEEGGEDKPVKSRSDEEEQLEKDEAEGREQQEKEKASPSKKNE